MRFNPYIEISNPLSDVYCHFFGEDEVYADIVQLQNEVTDLFYYLDEKLIEMSLSYIDPSDKNRVRSNTSWEMSKIHTYFNEFWKQTKLEPDKAPSFFQELKYNVSISEVYIKEEIAKFLK